MPETLQQQALKDCKAALAKAVKAGNKQEADWLRGQLRLIGFGAYS